MRINWLGVLFPLSSQLLLLDLAGGPRELQMEEHRRHNVESQTGGQVRAILEEKRGGHQQRPSSAIAAIARLKPRTRIYIALYFFTYIRDLRSFLFGFFF